MIPANGMDATIREAVRTTWDVIVVGGGPAGSLAARQAAFAGLKTLLVEAKHFPREKVCGGYLNQRALRVLQQARLEHLATGIAESSVRAIEMVCGRQRARFELPEGHVICRTTFDAALLESARSAGVIVLTGTQAIIEPTVRDQLRTIELVQHGVHDRIQTRVIVCADGLTRSSVRGLPEFSIVTAPSSHIGIGAVTADDDGACPFGQITMVVSRRGYVGISRIDRQQINVAAAIEPAQLSHSVPGDVVAAMLEEAEVQVPPALRQATWRGTPALTSRPLYVASERIFLIGDAGGYVEPFTGEGMANALETAVAVTPLVRQASRNWVPTIAVCWDELHRQIVRERQLTCRQLAWILRRPWAAHAALRVCRVLPNLAARVISKTSLPSTLGASPSIGAT